MRPVQGGTQKLTMNNAERDYQQKLRQSTAQADGNPFVSGLQQVMLEGGGEAVKMSRSKYGDTGLKPQEFLQGEHNNFRQKDNPYNTSISDPENQSGSLELNMSATTSPNRDIDEVATDKLEQRLQMYAKAGSNADFGNNNRQQTMSLN